MVSIEQQVYNSNDVMCQALDRCGDDRGFLSQTLLAQLRNLVEGLIVWSHQGDSTQEFDYSRVGPAVAAMKATGSNKALRTLTRFHWLLQSSTSHYTLAPDLSERLMLKYYAYLLRTREVAKSQLGVDILANVEKFPVDTDPALRQYYDEIADCVTRARATATTSRVIDRFYIHGSRPFVVNGRFYYELTVSVAHNYTSKFDRMIAFTDIDVTDHYAADLQLVDATIDVLGRTMPILVATSWQVSIRPCELSNFARLFGVQTYIHRRQHEYQDLMAYLTETQANLLDLMDMDDATYARLRVGITRRAGGTLTIFPVLDGARSLIRADARGARLLRYLMLRMRNEVVKAQYRNEVSYFLSPLYVDNACNPFDTMPFCTSPRSHNPGFADLSESLDASKRTHELLARKVRTNVEQNGMLYTPDSEVTDLGDVDRLIAAFNAALPPTPTHGRRKLLHDKGHVFITGYEDASVAIVTALQAHTTTGVIGHTARVQQWLAADPDSVDDDHKRSALESLFEFSKVAVIYGAAGTGKSTLVGHIADLLASERKLFLAHTNPAVDNLKRRVAAPNSDFSTITKFLNRSVREHYDLLVIDECSTVSNAAILKVLQGASFDRLVLVGDVYQIESIEFGNWFSIIRAYIPPESVTELTDPRRTKDAALKNFWKYVRSLDDRIEESMSKNGYSQPLGPALFDRDTDDEIVLCLNYDGLYGINNINLFMQASNPNPAAHWNGSTYKVGDPVLFNNAYRFSPVIFNNLKGTITAITVGRGLVTFDVALDVATPFTSQAEMLGTSLLWVSGTTVRFDVYQLASSDDDVDNADTNVPFQIAYAVSIHKAQGLEYNSVKVVITSSSEERISHNVFYTAVTRARRKLQVFWTPETQQRVLENMTVRENVKDEALLGRRRGLTRIAPRPRRAKTRTQP